MLTAMNYVARGVQVVAELGLADAVGEEPVSITTLAAETQTRPDELGRVLRLLAAYEVFTVEGDGVAHTPMSRLLRSDHPSSLRAFARMIGLSVNWRATEHLGHALRTGEAGMRVALPEGVWAHYADHPDDARIFDASMTSRASLMVPAIASAYDFSAYPALADIGGGRGHLLNAVLATTTTTRGILFDLPHVVAASREAGLHPRITGQPGDFFKDALPEADAYILMEILHDWPDEQADQIVAAVGRAARPGSRLLIMEIIPGATPGPAWAKTLDIVMLAHFGGKQRTVQEYRALLERNRFALHRQIDTPAGISILEAVAV